MTTPVLGWKKKWNWEKNKDKSVLFLIIWIDIKWDEYFILFSFMKKLEERKYYNNKRYFYLYLMYIYNKINFFESIIFIIYQ